MEGADVIDEAKVITHEEVNVRQSDDLNVGVRLGGARQCIRQSSGRRVGTK